MVETAKQKLTSRILRSAFTIVELLIVITVIGILAVITVTSYNGAQQRGYDVAILSDAEAMDGALANLSMENSGNLELGNAGYFYSDAAYDMSDPTGKQVLDELNAKLDFKPTKGNSIDVKLTNDKKEYCVRVFNEKSRNHFSIGTAVRVVSSKNVEIGTGITDSCSYEAGGQPTVYSGGAVPGAKEDIISTSGSFDVDDDAVRLDVAVIGPGGSGNGYCGGGGGAFSTGIIDNPASSYTVTIGRASDAGTNGGGKGTSSSFGPITSVGGDNAGSGCGILSLGVPGGIASPTYGNTSQKYGPSVNGGNGGAYLTLGLLAIAPGGGATGGGGYGASSNLINGGAGATGAWGNGGGGGGGTLLGLCSAPGIGGNAGGDYPGGSGIACNAGTNPGGGGAGNAGGGGGGKSNVSGGTPGKGGDGQVRVLTCFTQTCNPISTPLP